MKEWMGLLLVGLVGCDGASGPVLVEGMGFPGQVLTVIVHDASGTLMSRTRPQDGGAQFDVTVPSDGMVTLYGEEGGAPNAFTWIHVQPGDHLFYPFADTQIAREIHLDIPAMAGATRYSVDASCSESGSYGLLLDYAQADSVDATAFCSAEARDVTVMVVAANAIERWVALAAHVPIVTGGVTAVTLPPYVASNHTVNATLSNPWDDPTASTLVMTGIELTPTGSLHYGYAQSKPPNVGPVPSPEGPGYVVVDLGLSGSPRRELSVRRSFPSIPSTLEIDERVDLLPPVSASLHDDGSRLVITWSTDGTVPRSVAYALVGVETNAADWAIMVPSNPGTVRLPEMPVGFVRGPGRPSQLSYVAIVEASWLPDYETARNTPGFSRTTGSMRTSWASYR